MKNTWMLIGLSLLCFGCMLSLCMGCSSKAKKLQKKQEDQVNYAVLIGEEPETLLKSESEEALKKMDLLVIDADIYSSSDIKMLKANGVKEVYTYLNIGSLEKFRSYYEEYAPYTLGYYENWPEERWSDVANADWQDFIYKRAEELSKKGVDGFFLDNLDVYTMYPKEDIYNGIIHILKSLGRINKNIILNGGESFVREYLENSGKEVKPLFAGVNQESVYTCYDFERESFGVNLPEDRDNYVDYLDLVLASGYKAYVIEYAKEEDVKAEARKFSREHNYICYISENIELKKNCCDKA